MEAFQNALGDEQLQRHVFASKATTLAEAITLATKMEAIAQSQAHWRKGRTGAKEVRVVKEPYVSSPSKVRAAGGDPPLPIAPSRVQCHGCREYRHFRRDCPNGKGKGVAAQGRPLAEPAPAPRQRTGPTTLPAGWPAGQCRCS